MRLEDPTSSYRPEALDIGVSEGHQSENLQDPTYTNDVGLLYLWNMMNIKREENETYAQGLVAIVVIAVITG